MKKLLSWLGKRMASAVVTAVFFILAVLGIVYALSYPSTVPSGEVAGGKFMDNFNKIFNVMTFTGGKVGIGTSSPSQALTVSGVISTSNGIMFADGTIQKTAYIPIIYTGSTDVLHSYTVPAQAGGVGEGFWRTISNNWVARGDGNIDIILDACPYNVRPYSKIFHLAIVKYQYDGTETIVGSSTIFSGGTPRTTCGNLTLRGVAVHDLDKIYAQAYLWGGYGTDQILNGTFKVLGKKVQ